MKTNRFIILFLITILINKNAFSQQYKSGVDSLIYFKAGKGQNVGQEPQYFPQNVFGLPDTNAREDFQSADPTQICSLGFGGEIILGFKDFVVFDGDGPDFTIFENAFINPVTKKIFAEPAKVAVSEDGVIYYDFPFDSITLEGCAGKTPTYGNKDPFNPNESGGDQFDLADLGIKKINYIKITDISEYLKYNSNYPFYDPIISGFDLDAVVGLNLEKKYQHSIVSNRLENNDYKIVIREKTLSINSLLNESYKLLKIFNINGEELINTQFFDNININFDNYSKQLYLIIIIQCDQINTFKLIM